MKPSAKSLLGLALLVAALTCAQQWWAARHAAGLGAAVAELARPGDIRMLSSDSCAICDVARRWFVAHGVAYTECSVERDAACRAAFDATLAPGTPVLLVRQRVMVGFSPQRLQALLAPPG